MRIERLEPIPRSTRIRMVLDDGTSLKLIAAVAGDLGLYPGLELTEERLEEIRRAAGLASAKQRAVRILASSGTSEKELRRKLREKGETPENADKAVDWLEDLRLIDDEAAARQIVEREAAKGYGAARIRQTLRQKGIDRSLWDAAMRDMPEPREKILHYLETRLRDPSDPKEKKKVTDALLRRGFRWEDIRSCMNELQVSVEEDD